MNKLELTTKKIKSKNQKERGITLIALIVTIIILLILAGVSIATLTGDNGLLTKAQQAKEENEKAEQEERYNLAQQEDYINEYISGVTVEQVTDSNPGVLETEGADTYIINSIEDLVFFAYDVTNGNNYEEKTVKLGISLDFHSDKSYANPNRTDYAKYGYDGKLKMLLTTGEGFKSIGITTADDRTKNLVGTFDGDGYFINNLYINVTSEADFEKRGLFANNYGTINNVQLYNVNLYLNNKNGAIAGISGQNSITGNINNCIVSGNVRNESEQGSAGGITCSCSGSIQNCENLADVYMHTKNNSETRVGGIASNKGENGKIANCCNLGDITGEVEVNNLLIGGICGSISGEIKNCYNLGDITGKAINTLRIGGIVGNINVGAKVMCSYTTGIVVGNDAQTTTIGMIVGRNNGGTIENIYYKKIDETPGVGAANIDENLGVDADMAKTEEEMKTSEFIDLLNQGTENVWKQDLQNVNSGYPILQWQ